MSEKCLKLLLFCLMMLSEKYSSDYILLKLLDGARQQKTTQYSGVIT